VSDFLTNLARRGAGIAPQIAPRNPTLPAQASAAAAAGIDALEDGRDGARAVPDHNRSPMRWSELRIDSEVLPRAPAAASDTPQASHRPQRDAGGKTDDAGPSLEPAPQAKRRSDPQPPSGPTTAVQATNPASEAGAHATVAVTTLYPKSDLGVMRESFRPRSEAVAREPIVGPETGPSSGQLAPAPPQAKPESRSSLAPPGPPATAAPEQPRIHVRIGKVEVRASTPAIPPKQRARPKGSSGFSELRLARAHLDRDGR
jgi:hypothetical protein